MRVPRLGIAERTLSGSSGFFGLEGWPRISDYFRALFGVTACGSCPAKSLSARRFFRFCGTVP